MSRKLYAATATIPARLFSSSAPRHSQDLEPPQVNHSTAPSEQPTLKRGAQTQQKQEMNQFPLSVLINHRPSSHSTAAAGPHILPS